MATDKIQIGLRLPEDVRNLVIEAAASRNVSATKEITDRLILSFKDRPSLISPTELQQRMVEAKRVMAQLSAAITATAKAAKSRK